MFISRDPIGLMGGNNVFKYAPNPTRWIDPFGLEADYRDTSQLWAVKRRTDAAMLDAENAYKNGEYVDGTVYGVLGVLNQGIYPIAAVGDGVAVLAGAVGDTAEVVERPLFDLQLACMSSGAGPYCRGMMLAKAPVTTVKYTGKLINQLIRNKCVINSRRSVKQSHVGMQWGKGNMKQGMPWEDYVGRDLPDSARLPPNFKTFDYYDDVTRKAISVKTLDTTTPAKIANPKSIYSSIKGNIDATVNFTEHRLSGRRLTASQISSREIQLAVPNTTNQEQWTQIRRAIDYGKQNNVNVIVTRVKK